MYHEKAEMHNRASTQQTKQHKQKKHSYQYIRIVPK